MRYALTMVTTLGSGAAVTGLLWYLWLQHASAPMTDDILSPHFRDFLVHQALSLFATSPWLGVGPMHFTNTVNLIAGHPHNAYVMVLSEYGVAATLLILWIACGFLRRAFARVRELGSTQPILACALLASTVAMLVDSGFSGNWVMPISQMWIAVLVALLMSLEQASAAPAVIDRRPRLRLLGRALVLSVMVTATGMALMEIPDDIPHLYTGEPMKQPIGEQYLSFRFWSYGWF